MVGAATGAEAAACLEGSDAKALAPMLIQAKTTSGSSYHAVIGLAGADRQRQI